MFDKFPLFGAKHEDFRKTEQGGSGYRLQGTGYRDVIVDDFTATLPAHTPLFLI